VLAAILAVAIGGGAAAGPLEDAKSAFEAGEYAAAFRFF
jgi:hypothetical protein